MKICSLCKINKLESDFSFKGKKKAARCKDCCNNINKQWYQQNKSGKVAYTRKRQFESRKFVFNYLKDKKCVDCGENRMATLQFDHVKGEKSFVISRGVVSGCSLKTLIKEIDKCAIRCANCHAIKTSIEARWYKDFVP